MRLVTCVTELVHDLEQSLTVVPAGRSTRGLCLRRFFLAVCVGLCDRCEAVRLLPDCGSTSSDALSVVETDIEALTVVLPDFDEVARRSGGALIAPVGSDMFVLVLTPQQRWQTSH